MNLNPLENQKCRYDIAELFIENKESEYSWDRLKDNKDLLKSFGIDYSNYDYLLYSITDGIKWFVKAGHKDYQGDLFYLGKDKEGKYYYLNQSYGSCSGCDVYQANERDINGLNELREDMKRNIRQFDSLEEFKEYLLGDAKGSYYWYCNADFDDFVNILNNELNLNIELKNEEDI